MSLIYCLCQNHLDKPATVLYPPNDLHCRQDRVRCPADEQTDCAVYAVDGLDDDISSSITYVTSNPSCTATAADDLTCPMCAVEYMQQGLCLPGRYSAACLCVKEDSLHVMLNLHVALTLVVLLCCSHVLESQVKAITCA